MARPPTQPAHRIYVHFEQFSWGSRMLPGASCALRGRKTAAFARASFRIALKSSRGHGRRSSYGVSRLQCRRARGAEGMR
jgi:hypothetical protein